MEGTFYQNMFSDFIASYTTLFGALITVAIAIFSIKFWFDSQKIQDEAKKAAKKAAEEATKKVDEVAYKAAKESAKESAKEISDRSEEIMTQIIFCQISFFKEVAKNQPDSKIKVQFTILLIQTLVNLIEFYPKPIMFRFFLNEILEDLIFISNLKFYENYNELKQIINRLEKSFYRTKWEDGEDDRMPYEYLVDQLDEKLIELMKYQKDEDVVS